ncbi:MAG: cystathionine gamma-synthase family protein [Gemmatimonadetes bacterium]|nr:cystathionine gamma-synthase family protein [Gemmatimonadota bacterium]NNK64727.1 cystathionine gamma-synthase family protein [Gemmatimonadota bacterium]
MKDPSDKRTLGDHVLSPESLMMSYGYRPEWSEGAVKPPIFQTSTFAFRTAEEGKAFFEIAYGLRERRNDETLGLIYSRLNNPSLEILEDRLTLWDDAEAAASFESGMASIATTAFTFLRPGDVLAFSEPIYGGTEYLFHVILPEFGIETVPFPAVEGRAGLEAALSEGDRRERLAMIYVETPANPTNRLVDIGMCAEVARECTTEDRRVLVAVDNTFLGPLWQHPLKHGADLVLYSLTKFVGGHSDLIAGAVLGSDDLITRLKATRTFFGSMAGPWTGWLLLRSLETLKLRMTSQMKNARYVADYLLDHPKVDRVYYLGHLGENDPDFETYRRQCLSPGSMISFEVRGGEAEAFRLLNHLQLTKLAVSLGGTESLAEHPASMTHSDVPPADQARMGITPALVRLSVGVENPQDLIADLSQALEHV